MGTHERVTVLSSDHKPNRPDEQKRVEDAGGIVSRGTIYKGRIEML